MTEHGKRVLGRVWTLIAVHRRPLAADERNDVAMSKAVDADPLVDPLVDGEALSAVVALGRRVGFGHGVWVLAVPTRFSWHVNSSELLAK